MGIIAFRNKVQVALWNMEITGQLSDGHWENTRPLDHWKVWCDAKAVVDPTNVGRDFWAQKDNYALTSKALLEVIGKRMEVYARLAMFYGLEDAKLLENTVDIEGDFRGPPDYQDYGGHTTYADIREDLKRFDMEQVKAVVERDVLFTRKNLVTTLRDMKAIMRIRRS